MDARLKAARQTEGGGGRPRMPPGVPNSGGTNDGGIHLLSIPIQFENRGDIAVFHQFEFPHIFKIMTAFRENARKGGNVDYFRTGVACRQ